MSNLKLNANLRFFVRYGVIILGTIFLTISFLNYARPQINDKFARLNQENANLSTLTAKVELLREFSFDGDFAQVVPALTDKNPSALNIFKIRTDLATNGSELKSVESRSPSDFQDNIKKADVIYTFSSDDILKIIDFFALTGNSIPLTTLEDAKLTKEEGGFSVEVKTPVYWASYPTELPTMTEPLNGLTESETILLAKISGYQTSIPTAVDTPDELSQPRENPFD